MVWISVVLVIAVGLFLMRDNIAKFINNAATQIAGEASRPEGMNEYGFYFGKIYWDEDSPQEGFSFNEDGSTTYWYEDGGNLYSEIDWAPGVFTFGNGFVDMNGDTSYFSSDGKEVYWMGRNLKLQE